MKRILSLVLCLFLIGCTMGNECSVDDDCLPASCCHASEAVSKDKAPNCQGVLCTTECVPGTIDCGQGEIKCIKGSCEVVLKE